MPAALSLAFGSALLATAPASAAPEDLTVTSPLSGDVLESRVVTFTGTGTEDSVVTVLDAEGTQLPGTTPATVTDGLWTTTATYADDAAVEQTALVIQTTADLADGQAEVEFELPAAVVPDPEFAITSPEDGATLTTRTVVIDGTGTDDSAVVLTDADGELLPGTTTATVTDSTWSATVTYAEDADTAQSITATQLTDLAENGEETVDITLPAAVLPEPEPQPDAEFAVTSPEDGADLDSYTVVFEGTGTNGSTVDLLDWDDEPLAGAETATIANGVWSITVVFPEDADLFQLITAVQTTGDDEEYAFVGFYFPYELLPAPVITSPANGETVVGDQVTFTGTATPGTNVLLIIVPTSLLEELEDELEGEMGMNARAAAEPADPEDPILVDENGDWTVTLALLPDDYVAAAALIDPELGLPESDVSEIVEFSLIAAAAVAEPGDGGDGDGLAVTGSESSGYLGLAGAFLLAGVLALAARSRFARTEQ